MSVNFSTTIRGVEVEIFANNFECDPSVGLAGQHEELYAETLDGDDFELTDAEVEQLLIEAAEIEFSRDDSLEAGN